MNEKKQAYETPQLTVYGSVESITQATFKVGSGDLVFEILQEIGLNVPDTACNPRYPGLCVTGS